MRERKCREEVFEIGLNFFLGVFLENMRVGVGRISRETNGFLDFGERKEIAVKMRANKLSSCQKR